MSFCLTYCTKQWIALTSQSTFQASFGLTSAEINLVIVECWETIKSSTLRDRWIPHTNGQWRGKCSFWWRHHVMLVTILFHFLHYCSYMRKDHDDVIKWKHFPRYWPFVRRIHRSPVNSPQNSPIPGEFPAQRPVTRSFDVFFDLRLNKCLSKQGWGWWFETSLWRHRNVADTCTILVQRKDKNTVIFNILLGNLQRLCQFTNMKHNIKEKHLSNRPYSADYSHHRSPCIST